MVWGRALRALTRQIENRTESGEKVFTNSADMVDVETREELERHGWADQGQITEEGRQALETLEDAPAVDRVFRDPSLRQIKAAVEEGRREEEERRAAEAAAQAEAPDPATSVESPQ